MPLTTSVNFVIFCSYLILLTHNDHDQKYHTHMDVLAKYTPKLSCIGLLDFKTTKIHIPTIRKIHGKIHFAQFQWQFYKAVLSRNAGVYEALLYRRALCTMLGDRLYSLSFLTGVSTVLHSLYCTYSIPYCAML